MKKALKIKWFFIILFIPLLLVAVFVVLIDPFFHYHKPIEGLPYILSEERYQNDGIVKYFDYDSMITGTSVTQNFKTSEFEAIFGGTCIKTTYAGGRFKEVDSLVKKAIEYNPDLKVVLRGLDTSVINVDKDEAGYTDLPEYLYDKNPFNDYDYIFNKEVILKSGNILLRRLKGLTQMTSFDDYAEWGSYKTIGRDAVISRSTRMEKKDYGDVSLKEEDYTRIYDNIMTNVYETAAENPDITFYLFYPPYSILIWDGYNITGQTEAAIETMRYASGLLLELDNVKLYDFSDHIEIIGDLDNYMDALHYGPAINTEILTMIHDGEGLLTKDNYNAYFDSLYDIYADYDYDAVWE